MPERNYLRTKRTTMSVMLAASDLRVPARRQRDREFEYVLTYDRDLVAHAARSMLSRLTQRAAPLTEA